MNQPLAHRNEAPIEPMAGPDQSAMLSLFERLARDATIPIDRIREVMVMQREARAEMAKQAFTAALAAAQSEMRVVVADKNNAQTRSKFASYAALDASVRPIYTKHGFSVTFDTEDAPGKPDFVRIVADVASNGHERRYHIDMPADGKGAKGGDVMTKTHAVMSAASYGKRGLLVLIFNIPVADKWDDDGNAAGGSNTTAMITPEQIDELRKEMADRGIKEPAFCAFAGYALEDMPSADFATAIANVRRKPKKDG